MAEVERSAGSGAQQPQPGQVVTPGAAPQDLSQTVQAAPPSQSQAAPVSTAQPAASQPTPLAAQPQPRTATPEELASASFVRGETPEPSLDRVETAPAAAEGSISWTASEFVAHEKSSGWYLGLTAIAAVVACFVFLITRDIISTVVVLVGAAAFGILGSRKPRQQQYILDVGGLTIGQKRYDFGQFRSFSVVPEGAFSSIVFMPLKRFAQLTTIYYAPEDEDKIVDIISQSLPFEERPADAVDSLMKRVRF